jgi:hypothetical protein
MINGLACPLPGLYEYSYPTFVDRPQMLCIHFLTPDRLRVYVTYPNHPFPKAAQLLPVSWFASVRMVKLAAHPTLMHFLEQTLPKWLAIPGPQVLTTQFSNQLDSYTANSTLAA